MSPRLVAVTGFKGSGKDTIGSTLVSKFGFEKDSFAAPLKDACAVIFGWDREMLEGATTESREWREQEDTWWANKLDRPGFSPRFALQYIGTEVLRRNFNDDIWLLSLENRFLRGDNKIVVTDCRFQNELALVRKLGGITVQVNRGPKPDYWDLALAANQRQDKDLFVKLENELGVHASEYSWIGAQMDYVIDNDTTLDNLQEKTEKVYFNILAK